MSNTLKALVEKVIGIERETIEDGDEVLAKFFAEHAGKLSIFATPWRSEADKRAMLFMLREQFKTLDVDRYVMVSEAWMATQDKDDDDDRPPSERPDRQDVLWAVGVERGKSLAARCLVTGTAKKRRCGPIEWVDYDSLAGRMMRLLPERHMAS